MNLSTLARRGDELADPTAQRRLLASTGGARRFELALTDAGAEPLRAGGIEILQVNVGKLCNQTCRHCHVDAGPDRREIMSRETMRDCLALLERSGASTLDVTGGAPELNPYFRWFVSEAQSMGRRVIDRSNLTILVSPGYTDLPEFLAERRVEVVASLPCYLPENVDGQRGEGVFAKSIRALRRLNEVGYGRSGTGLELTLVYNPVGPSLPPPQPMLEAAYRCELRERYGIEFNRLYTITNMPISRFLADLAATGRLEVYLQRLIDAFNPATLSGLMCRTTLSVGWDGTLYDCDFNQMLDLPISPEVPRHVRDIDPACLVGRIIRTGPHCFGCTAGSGSSCQGAVIG
jgi:radical SAM/Cys-rich protein